MKSELLSRLEGLERRAPHVASARPAHHLFLSDDQTTILWDGTEGMREWAGRPLSDWPAGWLDDPYPVKLYAGIDPLVVFGIRRPETEG